MVELARRGLCSISLAWEKRDRTRTPRWERASERAMIFPQKRASRSHGIQPWNFTWNQGRFSSKNTHEVQSSNAVGIIAEIDVRIPRSKADLHTPGHLGECSGVLAPIVCMHTSCGFRGLSWTERIISPRSNLIEDHWNVRCLIKRCPGAKRALHVIKFGSPFGPRPWGNPNFSECS